METLPSELSDHILSLLDARQLASAGTVCRAWRNLTSQADVWKSLFERRWGKDKAATVVINLTPSKSWKSAYEVQHRRDRIGKKWNVIREGNSIYTAENGVLLRLLASFPKHRSSSEASGSSCSDPGTLVQSTRPAESSEKNGTTQAGERASVPGLLDRLLDFAADLHNSRSGAKRLRIRR